MPKTKPVFTLGGKPLNLNGAGGIVRAASRYLDKLPQGTLLRTKELAAAIGLTGVVNSRDKLHGYSIRHGRDVLWGSKQTIRDAEAILGDND